MLERGTLTEDGDLRSFFFVSSVPWLHYTHAQNPMENPNDSNPRINWGKYVTANGRTTLPVTLTVHHALADGLHISKFYQKLEEELAALTRQWNESKKRFLVYIAKEITTMSHPYHGLNELREMFLKFFETKGHLRLPSFSLVPQNDKSILLINAGMTPHEALVQGRGGAALPPRLHLSEVHPYR